MIPGVESAEKSLIDALGGKSLLLGNKLEHLQHIFMGTLVVLLCVLLASRYKKHLTAAGDEGVVPESRFNARSVVEIICTATLSIMNGIMGKTAAKAFFPFIGSLALFILVSNLLGLIPGFLPATESANTNLALAGLVFLATHVYGLKVNGMDHIKHLFGPVWWLAPLMFPIEVISHLARPLSLTLRLAGNMIGDHKVLGLFLGLAPILVPVPIMVLGIIVCVVQALVFCMLSVVYIGLAIEEHHHDEHDHAHDGEHAHAH
jgi:F-type H+-transporting ATPase subunit a